MAVPWLIVGQLVLGNLDKIIGVVKPAFTRKKLESTAGQPDLLNQQISELQAASTSNAEQIGQLAAQLKEVVATISQTASEAAAHRATTRRISYASLGLALLALVFAGVANAEITRHGGKKEALPDRQYVRVVSETDSPVQQSWIKARDGVYIASAIRKPKGAGPFPAIIIFHGAPGGRGMEQLVGWSRGDHGGPVWERFLQEGYVVVVADYRGGDWELMNSPSPKLTTAIDDGVSVIEYVRSLPYVKRDNVSVYGVSLGGNLAMFLASRVPDLHAVVAGAPAPIWFLGYKLGADGSRPDFAKTPPDPVASKANIEPIKTPVLIIVGTEDRLMPLDIVLHDELVKHGKSARLEIYEHGYHDFVLGNQGQKRGDLPRGEILLPGALEALELTVKFVRNPGNVSSAGASRAPSRWDRIRIPARRSCPSAAGCGPVHDPIPFAGESPPR